MNRDEQHREIGKAFEDRRSALDEQAGYLELQRGLHRHPNGIHRLRWAGHEELDRLRSVGR